MNFLDIAKTRYSVRSYKDKRVEKEKLEQILEAAHVAPTAANLQPVRLLVVQEKEGLDKIGEAANIYSAPLAIIVCSDHSIAWKRPFDNKQTTDIDASIVTDHMMLEATELGLGTVWVCYFKPDIIKKEFEFQWENILNVACTRAKYRIAFIGNINDWKNRRYFREFIPNLIDIKNV